MAEGLLKFLVFVSFQMDFRNWEYTPRHTVCELHECSLATLFGQSSRRFHMQDSLKYDGRTTEKIPYILQLTTGNLKQHLNSKEYA